MCRCADRRAALGRAFTSLTQGDLDAAKAASGFVARTLVEDGRVLVAEAKAARLAAAHARLKR